MPQPSVMEISADDIVVRYSDRVFRPVRRDIQVPAALSGKYVCAVAVITSVALNDTQEAQLKAAIEAIAGVDSAHVLVGSSRLSLDRMPADTADTTYSYHVGVEMGFDVRATEVTP